MRKIKIKNADIPITLENEEIPTKSKIRDVPDSASARQRVMISFVALAGLRPQVLGKYDSSDGLKLSDIRGLEIKSYVGFSIKLNLFRFYVSIKYILLYFNVKN